MTRWKAFVLHLGITALVFTALALTLAATWYPRGLWEAAGAVRLFAVTAVISGIVGPLLTLLVFKPGKKHLKFDLGVIALLQVAALGYGLWMMWQTRPVFLVGLLDRFELVLADELDPADLIRGRKPEFHTLSLTGPRLVGATLPVTPEERLQAIMEGLAGKDLHRKPRHYADYGAVARDLARAGQPPDALQDTYPETARAIEAAARALGRAPASVRYLPIVARRGRATMLVDARTGEVLRAIPVDPWPDLAGRLPEPPQ
ncbi:TfpX/TfpZ family type IV pilin accessory protein [Vulcaniibacterium gelatinicum]|uniref:TfpX/TfpZ family type IV pilin accessory protein n=1 Tax=Vulcaniibacterium gelatinicum TaxID=2598725 RepID=UPI0011C81305|nr:TfpX/TfpZ family type IV pilin accessory protein [Vulcaniibacterium gelatinicum]